MREFINSVNKSIQSQNWYAALFMSLTLPDICGEVENPEKSSVVRYRDFISKYLPKYQNFLSGDDFYALRCALLHKGKDDITDQTKRKVLEHYVFLTSGSHLNLFKDCVFNGEKKSFLQLNVQRFCEDICDGIKVWLKETFNNPVIQNRLKDIIEIHQPGYSYKGLVRFG